MGSATIERATEGVVIQGVDPVRVRVHSAIAAGGVRISPRIERPQSGRAIVTPVEATIPRQLAEAFGPAICEIIPPVPAEEAPPAAKQQKTPRDKQQLGGRDK